MNEKMEANKRLTCYKFNSTFQVCIQEPKKSKDCPLGSENGRKGRKIMKKFPPISLFASEIMGRMLFDVK